MSMRRLFYESILQQIYYDNQVTNKMISIKQKYLQGVINENNTIESLLASQIEKKTKQNKNKMLTLAKDCIGIEFKMQKRMLSDK